MKKRHECSAYRCSESPYRNGLCEAHYEENCKKSLRRNAAVNAFHLGVIDGRLAATQELREEFVKIKRWWDRACRATNNNFEDEVLCDETEYALEWCIAIAQEIIDEELAYRLGRVGNPLSKEIKKIAWERFDNLEAGLMSNGVPRSNNKRNILK
jgi:hypothetical protein